MNTCKIVNWNIAWRRKQFAAGAEIKRRIAKEDADLLCLTEGHTDFVDGGHIITSDRDYGYPIKSGRRKVMLWSRAPWHSVDALGDPDLPGGRFVSGVTNTPIGPLRVIGVCIPWNAAHVASGRRDRQLWQDHLIYLDALKNMLASAPGEKTVVVGDFNQRIPRARSPAAAYAKLISALEPAFVFATSGPIPDLNRQTVDHTALTRDLKATRVCSVSNVGSNGKLLSDHFGISLHIA